MTMKTKTNRLVVRMPLKEEQFDVVIQDRHGIRKVGQCNRTGMSRFGPEATFVRHDLRQRGASMFDVFMAILVCTSCLLGLFAVCGMLHAFLFGH